jgi:hypothetical protein
MAAETLGGFRSHISARSFYMDGNGHIANRRTNEIDASRPGPIAITVLIIAFGIIFSVGNWKMVSGWFS